MSVNPLLLPIIKDRATIKKNVLTNIIKMITYRGWLKKENLEENIKNITSLHADDDIYKIKLDVLLKDVPFYDPITEDKFDNNVLYVKLLAQKIVGINKSPIITDFFTTYKNSHKILVVESISEKQEQQIDSYLYCEVFKEHMLLINLVDHHCSPQYEVLTPTELDEFLLSYQVKKTQLDKINLNDPASKYLYLKKGQIIRIIRNSESTGSSIAYRIVKKNMITS